MYRVITCTSCEPNSIEFRPFYICFYTKYVRSYYASKITLTMLCCVTIIRYDIEKEIYVIVLLFSYKPIKRKSEESHLVTDQIFLVSTAFHISKSAFSSCRNYCIVHPQETFFMTSRFFKY